MYNYNANRYSLDPPPFLQSEYMPAAGRFEKQLPLPGRSVKIPFEEKPTRFLNLNRKKYELDYLRSQIQHKVQMEELHYQARIEQMRRENELNRYRLEQMLKEHPNKNLFAAPHEIADEAKSVDSNLSNLSNLELNQLYKKKQRLYTDSLDKLKQKNQKPKRGGSAQSFVGGATNFKQYHSKSINEENNSDSSNDTEERYRKKMERQEQLDYIYKRREDPKEQKQKSSQNFSLELKKKEDPQEMTEEKRREYEWVKKVRKARGNPVFVIDEVRSQAESSNVSEKKSVSSDSSSISSKPSKKVNGLSKKNESSDRSSAPSPQPALRTGRMVKHANPESVYPQKRQMVRDRYAGSEVSSASRGVEGRGWRQ